MDVKEKEEIIEINNGESHRVLELAMEAGRILLKKRCGDLPGGGDGMAYLRALWSTRTGYICAEQWDLYHSR